MFRRFPKITRFLIYYFSCLLLIYLIDVLFDQTFLQVFNLNKHLTSDIHLNDIYYRKHSTSGDSYMEDEKKVILVNIQEIPFSVEGREMYVKLLNKLIDYNSAAIGVDVTFSKTQKDVFQSVKNNPKIIFANQNSSSDISFPNNGDILFPEIDGQVQHSIRYYKNDENSFGAKLVKAANFKFNRRIGDSENFIIHYNSYHAGLCHLTNYDEFNYVKKYQFLNASEVLDDSLNNWKAEFDGKIVIIGYLGDRSHSNADFDIEDKKQVPVDTSKLVNRMPVMFGAVVHANAISTILNDEFHFYIVSDGTILFVNLIIFAIYLYILLFKNLGKLFNLLILFLMTLPILFLIFFLMECGIYYLFGGTLLALLVIEEFYEIIEPFEHKYLSKYYKNE